jgi:ATP-dependent RNA/DNA helicase IGHMBP2
VQGLAYSLFERLHEEEIGDSHMLTTQFRMHEKIMRWISEQMYEGRLVAHHSVQYHELKHLEYFS